VQVLQIEDETRLDSNATASRQVRVYIRLIPAAARCSSAKIASTHSQDETISLHIGNEFDIVAERKQDRYKTLRTVCTSSSIEIGRCGTTRTRPSPSRSTNDWRRLEMVSSTINSRRRALRAIARCRSIKDGRRC